MFKFAHPNFLYLLLVLPVLFLIYLFFIYMKKKNLRKFGNPVLLKQLMPGLSYKRQYLKFWFIFAAIALVIFTIAGPQFGSKVETVKKKGIEVIVCLDISNSMMSEDIVPNRLEKAKQILSKLVDGFSNDKVGLIVFAGDAHIQVPITSDYLAAKMFISSINTQIISRQGTAIGAAVTLANSSFTGNLEAEKAIVLITDGEDHEDNAIEAAKAAASKGIKIHVIGLGTPQGAPIPTAPGKKDFRKDAFGNFVVTKLNEEMCIQLAEAGNGSYVRADNSNLALKTVQTELDKLNKVEMESKVYSEYDERFQTLAWIALFLLIVEIFILDRKNKIFSKVKLFK